MNSPLHLCAFPLWKVLWTIGRICDRAWWWLIGGMKGTRCRSSRLIVNRLEKDIRLMFILVYCGIIRLIDGLGGSISTMKNRLQDRLSQLGKTEIGRHY